MTKRQVSSSTDETAPFNRYSRYYDLLYRDKDYATETEYVTRLLRKHSDGAVETVLDIGCGTGSHALLLARQGFSLTCVDVSETMLAIAADKVRESGLMIELLRQDLQKLSLNARTFDAVVAMFAVMGYQTSNDGMVRALTAIHRHLKPGGIFIFDVWHGAAVLTGKPEERVKIVQDGSARIIRMARPELAPLEDRVTVNYKVLYIDGRDIIEESDEAHEMRYFFVQDLRYMLDVNGFDTLDVLPFLQDSGNPTQHDWNISIVARRR